MASVTEHCLPEFSDNIVTVLPLLPLLLLVAAGEGPEWGKAELKSLITAAEGAAGAKSVVAQDDELANTAGAAYRVTRKPGEMVDAYARRILKTRDPSHPPVAPNQSLLATMRYFWSDVNKRASLLARFERDRRETRYLEEKAAQGKKFADTLAPMIQIKVEGIDGAMAPLPVCPTADPATTFGARALIRSGGKIVVEDMERMTWADDAPPAKLERTSLGSIRELYAALKQFDLSSQMMARVDPHTKKSVGQLRIFVPSASPSIYLNELARAGREARLHTLYVMCVGKGDGALQQLTLSLDRGSVKAKPGKGKPKTKAEPVGVRCADADPVQLCVDRMVEARSAGSPVFVTE